MGAYYGLYSNMMDHWRELFPGRIIELDYDELVTDPEPQICQLISALGLSWNDKCLDVQSNTRAVKTLSVFSGAAAHLGGLGDWLGEIP